ncbi:PucR family transcriptional regulator ligand-binding domain-containing protein [Paenibacillus polysaccharolyticus]|uniref:PucR family transcriptional regulator n=1 Tax=Paenibacillus polysaccharolyticus TaxID=582692 RepID=UPI00203BACDA|nr:PucR family transcriptional regulator [Paenibacillus polysaccharolyticus]MCM3132766.1 PucR family transcriptional regulator ligand-binding domain-containing protein [Paenibacillus polysaccharolyticus]
MQLTVKEALQVYPLSEAKLIAGREGTSRMMKSVNVMDAPDIADWIKSGEMLFTTAFMIKDSETDTLRLMQRLNERGCAGIGIKLGRFWDSIPQGIVEEANRLRLPLLELPFQFTFSDQMNALFKAEHERSHRLLHEVVQKQKKLMQFALQQQQHRNVFAEMSTILNYSIAVIGSRGHVLYANDDVMSDNAVTQGWPWKSVMHRVKWNQGSCHRVPIQQKDEELGFLLVYTDSALSLRAEEELFQQAADVLAFYMDMTYREHINPTVQDEMRTLLTQYMEQKLTIQELMTLSENKGVHLFQETYQCVLTTLEPNAFAEGKLLKQIHRELQYNPLMQFTASQHFQMNEGILSIYSCPTGRDYGEELSAFLLNRFGDVLTAQEAKGAPGPRFWISKMKHEPTSLREAYQECLDTRQLAQRLGMKDRALQFEMLEFAYVFQHVPEQMMENYCHKVLEPLLARDGDPNQVLMSTLESFIENDGLINEAAKQLYVHRNTVTYRMEKIGSLLQMDFKKTNDLLKLKLVFTFRKFVRDKAPVRLRT